MREIKFRAMVIDEFKHQYPGFSYGLITLRYSQRTRLPDSFSMQTPCSYDNSKSAIVEIIPETIGQFTGLKDKNGVEIFEGDIISVNGSHEKIVEFDAEYFGFVLINISDLKHKEWMSVKQRPHSSWFTDFKREIKVIGNIHQNPELLK